LLAREAGEREPDLTTSLPALQLYLEGMRAQRAGRYQTAASAFDAALDADSNFIRAAQGLFEAGDWLVPTEGRRYVARARSTIWRLRERLTRRQHLELDPIVGARYPLTPTFAEIDHGLERAIAAGIDRPEIWYHIGDNRLHWGRMMGAEDRLDFAERRFRKVLSLDSSYVPAMEHLAEIRWERGDTTEANRLARVYLRDTAALHHDYVRWRLALATGDSLERKRVRSRMGVIEDLSLMRIMAAAVDEQLPLEDADLAADAMLERLRTDAQGRQGVLYVYSGYQLIRGRPSKAAAAWRELGDMQGGLAHIPVWDAVLSVGDTGAARRALNALATRLQSTSDNPQREAGRAHATCAHALWAYRTGDTAASQRLLADVAKRPIADQPTVAAQYFWPQCVLAMRAIVAVDMRRPDARGLVDRLDSLARTWVGEGFAGLSYNSIIASLYDRLGDARAALAAHQRRPHHPNGTMMAHPADRIREEGRLRAVLGDSAGAIRAYQHYLFLRRDAEPQVQPEVHRVRTDLERLLRTRG